MTVPHGCVDELNHSHSHSFAFLRTSSPQRVIPWRQLVVSGAFLSNFLPAKVWEQALAPLPPNRLEKLP